MKFYKCDGKIISEEEARMTEESSRKTWNDFWSTPRNKRKPEDWLKLLDIKFCIPTEA